ncbi:DUF885 family protein [Acidobacteriota bacterium]
MKKTGFFILGFIVLLYLFCSPDPKKTFSVPELSSEYISCWKQFYPSRAFSRGFLDSIFDFEDYSMEGIELWVEFNKKALGSIEKNLAKMISADRIDARLLRTQIFSELEKWDVEAPHRNSLSFYSSPISRAVSRILDAEGLQNGEKLRIIKERLQEIKTICSTAFSEFENGSPNNTKRSLKTLERAVEFYEKTLPERIFSWMNPQDFEVFKEECLEVAVQINSLVDHVQNKIIPNLSLSDSQILGREKYARQLGLYTDSPLTPEELERMALEEIQNVRKEMALASEEYLKEAYPNETIPETFETLVGKALYDMESNHPSGNEEYLKLLRDFAEEAEDFVRKKKIATIPEHQTLSIEIAPESSGASARIGYVSPPPAFSPNPWTTWYLATIPDSFPEDEKEDFWRSFNNHFKKFIVIHELFPGHYIQRKLTRENPHPVRILFSYRPYSEGFATLCERIALEAGWDNFNKLTKLAQLRKKLENANRAYTSIQVHCNGWDEKQVLEFSIQTSLLAPQFAKSLWGRLMRSPIQITSYFLGYHMFDAVYEAELKRRGDEFVTLDFMDTILQAGPIPIDEFPTVFKDNFPSK